MPCLLGCHLIKIKWCMALHLLFPVTAVISLEDMFECENTLMKFIVSMHYKSNGIWLMLRSQTVPLLFHGASKKLWQKRYHDQIQNAYTNATSVIFTAPLAVTSSFVDLLCGVSLTYFSLRGRSRRRPAASAYGRSGSSCWRPQRRPGRGEARSWRESNNLNDIYRLHRCM